ncbi:MAG: hypothetical protein KF823_03695 [Xanthomonadales bacterium]|nr:hypothetical protein [Xanthomonadales bacterium]
MDMLGLPISPFALLVAVGVALALAGMAALVSLLRALRARRPGRVVSRLLLLLVLDGMALLVLLLALALHGYGRLTGETLVAELAFRQLGEGLYEVELAQPDGSSARYQLAGDDWQLDARVVKWRPWAVLAGLDPVYRLDRLSGRWHDLERERAPGRSVHDLAGDGMVDLWSLASRHPRWLPFVDTEYGSGAYLPMRDGARYSVTLSPLGGLVARPLP